MVGLETALVVEGVVSLSATWVTFPITATVWSAAVEFGFAIGKLSELPKSKLRATTAVDMNIVTVLVLGKGSAKRKVKTKK